jgi:hypothetical protein
MPFIERAINSQFSFSKGLDNRVVDAGSTGRDLAGNDYMAELAVDAVVLLYERVSKVRFDRNPKFSCNSPGNQAKSDGFLLKKKMQIRYKGLGMGVTQNTLRSAQVLDL